MVRRVGGLSCELGKLCHYNNCSGHGFRQRDPRDISEMDKSSKFAQSLATYQGKEALVPPKTF